MLPAPCGQATLASHDERYRAVAWRCANERTFARFPRTGVVGIGVAAFIAVVGGTMWTVNSRVIIQSAVPNELLGRFNAASRLVGWGMTPIAAAVAGILAQLLSFRAAFGAFAIGCAALVYPYLKIVTPAAIAAADRPRAS